LHAHEQKKSYVSLHYTRTLRVRLNWIVGLMTSGVSM